METIWTLIESCIIPIITYGSETWDINQNQTKRLNRILDNIIKRILNLPQSTPRECLYYELGTLDIEHRIITKRINYATTLLIKNPDNLRDILQTTNPKSWIQKTIQQARSVGLDLDTLKPYSHRSEAKRSEPYCRIHTIHTSTECAAMCIPQFDSVHTAHSRMRFVSHWKRSEAHYSVLLWVALFCLTPFPVPFVYGVDLPSQHLSVCHCYIYLLYLNSAP